MKLSNYDETPFCCDLELCDFVSLSVRYLKPHQSIHIGDRPVPMKNFMNEKGLDSGEITQEKGHTPAKRGER